MTFILSAIHTLDQHLSTYLYHPSRFKPERCPHCNSKKLWAHGCYYRVARCEAPSANPAPIPRFLCAQCYRTCSTLPEFIPPKRHYHWIIQQVVLSLCCAGHSLMQIWQACCDRASPDCIVPSISTLQRWRVRWKQGFSVHRFHLLTYHSALGYQTDFNEFWPAVFKRWPLSTVMRQVLLQVGALP